MVLYRASALCGLLHVHAARLRVDNTEGIDLRKYIHDVDADLYRANSLRIERCATMNENEYLHLTPDLNRSIYFANSDLWVSLYCDVDRNRDVYNDKDVFRKAMDNLSIFSGSIQKMNVQAKVFKVTAQSLADLFAHQKYFDEVEDFSWKVELEFGFVQRTLTSSRANMVRLGFQFVCGDQEYIMENLEEPQDELWLCQEDAGATLTHKSDPTYLNPAIKVLQTFLRQYPEVAGLSNLENVFSTDHLKSMVPEYVLWKKTVVASCTDKIIMAIPFQKEADPFIEEVRERALAYHRRDCPNLEKWFNFYKKRNALFEPAPRSFHESPIYQKPMK